MVMGQNFLREGMLVKTKWRSYLPSDFSPFAMRLTPHELVQCLKTNTITRFHSVENLPQSSVAMIIRILENNDVVILVGERFFCIRSDFLEPLKEAS
jgi:hypothetical protein